MANTKKTTKTTKHSMLELLGLVESDELVRVIRKVIEIQENGTIDKLLDILGAISQDEKTVDRIYTKIMDLSKKGTINKLLEGNLLDRQLDAILNLMKDGSLIKLIDLFEDLQKKGLPELIDFISDLQKKGVLVQLIQMAPKLTVFINKLGDLESQGLLSTEKLTGLIEKITVMMNDGTIDKLLELVVMLSAMLDAFNENMIKGLASKVNKVLELADPNNL
ncbi:MAG: hypothetical protein ACP5NL_03545 [Thermoplasmata archaeon]